jgi:hypothetical protein
MTPNDGPFINVAILFSFISEGIFITLIFFGVNVHHFVKKIMYYFVVSFLYFKITKNNNQLQ